MSCVVGCRQGLDPTLLWLWRRPEATALIRPLAGEPPYAAEAQEMAKRQKKLNTTLLTAIINPLEVKNVLEDFKGRWYSSVN